MATEEQQESTPLDGEISLDNLAGLFESQEVIEEQSIEQQLEETETQEEEQEEATEESTEETTEEQEEAAEETQEQENEEEEQEESSEAQQEEQEQEEVQVSPAFNQVKSLLDLGILTDIKISTSEDDEEGKLLSEFEDINEAQLKQIIDIQKSTKDKEIEEKYISKEGLTENQLKIVNILKEGGDLKEIFQSPEQIKRPFEGWDLEDDKKQKQIILHHYINNLGHSNKEALALLKQKEEDYEVDSFSKEIVQAYNSEYDKYLDSKQKELQVKNEEKKKRITETRKDLSKVLKDNKFKDSISKKIIDGVTKPIGDNKFKVHEVLEEILENPKDNYEVLLHLLDRSAFNELYKVKQKNKETASMIRLIDALPNDKIKKVETAKKETGFTSELEEAIATIKLR